MDCSVVATQLPGILMVTTTDFFYPLVEDPYLQGRIGACNVLSDLYAMGVTDVDTVLMILAASLDMTSNERDIVTTQLIKGFNDTCAEADTNVTGGQTVLNPCPIIGGTACALCTESQIIRPEAGRPGDVLVLTKPLGTQVAVNCQEWSRDQHRCQRITDVITCKFTSSVCSICMTSNAPPLAPLCSGDSTRSVCDSMREHGAAQSYSSAFDAQGMS